MGLANRLSTRHRIATKKFGSMLIGGRRRRVVATAAAVACSALAAHSAKAVAYTWTQGAAGTWNWSSASNWDPTNGVPVSDPAAVVNFFTANTTVIPASPGINAVNDLSPNPLVLNTLNLYGNSVTSTGVFNITGNALQFDGTGAALNMNASYGAGSGTTYSIANNLVFDTATTINYTNNGGNLNLTGALSGSGAINYIGPASSRTLSLGKASSTYSGAVTISSGQIKLTAFDALGVGGVGNTISVANNAVLYLGGFNAGVGTLPNPITIQGNGGTGGGSLGALQLTNDPYDFNNDNSGDTVGGAVTLAGTTSIGGTTTSRTLGNGIATGDVLVVSGQISGSYGLTKVGNSILKLTNYSNSYTGGLTVSAGIAMINGLLLDNSSHTLFGTGGLTLSGGTLEYLGNNQNYQSANLTQTVTIGTPGSTSTFTGTIDTEGSQASSTANSMFTNFALAGSGTLVKLGAGTLGLEANASTAGYTGAVNVSVGTLAIWSGNALGTTANTVTVSTGATVNLFSYGNYTLPQGFVLNGTGIAGTGALLDTGSGYNQTLTGPINVATAASLANAASYPLVLTGPISGTAGLTVGTAAANKIVTLTNTSSTYSGTATVAYGQLQLNSAGNLGATATIAVNSGAFANIGGFSYYTLPQNWILAGNGDGNGAIQIFQDPFQYGPFLTLSGSVTLAGDTTLGGAAIHAGTTPEAYVISGAVSGSYALTKIGVDTLQLTNAANTYTNGTTVSAGVLAFNSTLPASSPSALGTGNVTINGGTLQYNGADNAYYQPATNFARTITVGASGGTFDTTNNGTQVYGNFVLDGAGTLTKIGTRSLGLAAASPTFSGNVNVSAGGLQLWTGGALGTTASTVTVSSGAHLDLASYNSYSIPQNLVLNGAGDGNGALQIYGNPTAALVVNGTLSLASDTTVGGSAGVNLLTVNGVVSGSGSLIKTGAVTLTLAATNTYSGNTLVSAGVLSVTGALPTTTNLTAAGGTATFAAAGLGAGTSLVALNTVTVSSGLVNLLPHANGATSPATATHDHSVLVTNSLALAGSAGAWTTSIDLANNDLLIHATPANSQATLATVEDQLHSARNGNNANGIGAWNGQGITTSTAVADNTNFGHGVEYYTLGDVRNGDLALAGAASFTTFDGQSVGADDILVKYTYAGDATLDGNVTSDDYSLIDQGFLFHYTGWVNGDFDHSGSVTGNDYGLIDQSFLLHGPALAAEAEITQHAAEFGASYTAAIAPAIAAFDAGTGSTFSLGGTSAVPEPTTLDLLAIGATGLLARRRRK